MAAGHERQSSRHARRGSRPRPRWPTGGRPAWRRAGWRWPRRRGGRHGLTTTIGVSGWPWRDDVEKGVVARHASWRREWGVRVQQLVPWLERDDVGVERRDLLRRDDLASGRTGVAEVDDVEPVRRAGDRGPGPRPARRPPSPRRSSRRSTASGAGWGGLDRAADGGHRVARPASSPRAGRRRPARPGPAPSGRRIAARRSTDPRTAGASASSSSRHQRGEGRARALAAVAEVVGLGAVESSRTPPASPTSSSRTPAGIAAIAHVSIGRRAKSAGSARGIRRRPVPPATAHPDSRPAAKRLAVVAAVIGSPVGHRVRELGADAAVDHQRLTAHVRGEVGR